MHRQICTIKNVIQSVSTDRCIYRKNKMSLSRIPTRKTRRCPPPRDVAETRKAPADIPKSVPSTIFPLLPLLLLLLSWSACGYYATRLAVMRMLFPSLSYCCSQHSISTRPLPPPLYSPQQSARDHDTPRDFPNQSLRRVVHSLATVRLLAKLVCRHVSPRCAITPYLLSPRLAAAAAVVAAAAVAECARPQLAT